MEKINDGYVNYFDLLIEDLKDITESAGYLSMLIATYNENDGISRSVLEGGLTNVIKAQGGFERITEITGFDQKSIERELFGNRNQIEVLILTLRALGLGLQIKPTCSVAREAETIKQDESIPTYSTA